MTATNKSLVSLSELMQTNNLQQSYNNQHHTLFTLLEFPVKFNIAVGHVPNL